MKKLASLAFIISLSSLSSQPLLAEIKAAVPAPENEPTQKLNFAWLGIWIDDVPISLGKHLSSLLKDNQGVLVRKISPDSPAAKAGINEFDIITKFNNQEIFTGEQLTRLVRSTQIKTTVKLTLIRQGQLTTQDVILEASPKQSSIRHRPGIPHGHFSPFRPYHRPDMNTIPPWTKPFFHQRPDLNPPMPPQNFQQNSWSEFESIQIESTGDGKHRAKIKHKDRDGNTKEFVFEGNREEIREQILKLEEMDERTRQNLLQALDMNNTIPIPRNSFAPHHRMMPDWLKQPFATPPGFYNK